MKRGSSLLSTLALLTTLGVAAGARGQPPTDEAPEASPDADAEADAAASTPDEEAVEVEPDEPDAEPPIDPVETPDEEEVDDEELALALPPVTIEPPSLFDTRIYGFIDSQWRYQIGDNWPDPALRPPAHQPGFDVTPTLMVQGTVASIFRYFIILTAPFSGGPDVDLSVDLRNAWVEASIFGDMLNVRVGKTYRRFGLYNEILDATPTFIGTEPPAYLNPGQLLLTRTTNLMIHGAFTAGDHALGYAVTTGSDEVGGERVPIGGDLRYTFSDIFTLGVSGYWSGGNARPTRDVGEGASHGGVINYMEHDEYFVAGAFAQLQIEGLLVQGAYFRAHHDARRNPMKVFAIATMTPVGMRLNMGQRERLFNGVDIGSLTPMDVNIEAQYVVQTAYARLAYEFQLGDAGALTVYGIFDWYYNEEAIPGPVVGGNEAGLSDDAQFYRVTPGLMYRPIPAVALKAEFNTRLQTIMDDLQAFYEVRASLSYLWEL